MVDRAEGCWIYILLGLRFVMSDRMDDRAVVLMVLLLREVDPAAVCRVLLLWLWMFCIVRLLLLDCESRLSCGTSGGKVEGMV